MDLIEYQSKETVRRELAAQRLRDIADELSRQNEISFVRDGVTHTISVPDEVELKVEIEIGGDTSEIEVELTW